MNSWMLRVIACGIFVLTSLFAWGTDVPSPDSRDAIIEQQVRFLPRGAVVEIRLTSHQKFRGRLVDVSEGHLAVRWLNDEQIEDRRIVFAEVQSVKEIRNRPSRLRAIGRYALVGALGGAVGVVELAKEDSP